MRGRAERSKRDRKGRTGNKQKGWDKLYVDVPMLEVRISPIRRPIILHDVRVYYLGYFPLLVGDSDVCIIRFFYQIKETLTRMNRCVCRNLKMNLLSINP